MICWVWKRVVKDLLVCLPESGAEGSQPGHIPGSQQGVPPGSENSKINFCDAQSCMLRMCWMPAGERN